MGRHRLKRDPGRVGRFLVAGICAVLSLGLTAAGTAEITAPPSGARVENTTAETSPSDVPSQAASPVRIRVPSLGVDAAVDPLGLTRQSELRPPSSNRRTGWWRDGPEPGEVGPAVIAGHVDSRTGPAVFHGLTELRPGSGIFIDRADGSTVVFRVSAVEQHAKDEFPTRAVYGPTANSELRLITCGGTFDDSAGSYRANVVVFATRTH